MTKIILASLLAICFTSVLAQHKIVKLNSDTINCIVSEITDANIKYTYEGEQVLNNISKNTVKEIIYSSGRVQKFSSKIIINGEDDWEKVQVTRLESDIAGLTKIGDVNVKSKAFMSADVGKQQKKAMEKLKREAAKKGAHIVLLLEQVTTTYNDAPRIALTGILYKY